MGAVTSVPPPLPAAVPTLSAEQMQQLAAAQITGRKIRTAAAVAAFDAWTIAIFAGLSCVCGISSVKGMVVGLGMGIIAFVEFRGLARLKRLDVKAPRMLGFNQLALAGLLIVYALWSLYSETAGGGTYAQLRAIDPAAAEMIEPIAKMLVVAVYGGVILVAIAAQGGMALYYFTRAKYIKTHLERTPAWIVQMQQAGISV